MKKQLFHKLVLLLTGCFLLTGFSCEKEDDNNQNPADDTPAELKVTDITLSSCIDSINTTNILLKMIDDNELKVIHHGAEFCCSDTGKADIELLENKDTISLQEIDLGPLTYCFCKHDLKFTLSGISYGVQKFKIVESEHAYQRDTLEFWLDLSPTTDTIIHF